MRPPSVSVCIPVRNGQEQLRHTLANLLIHSTYPSDRWEVLLGDHESTDDTSTIIADFQDRFPRVRSVRVPYTSANRARVRNRIICESSGDLLVFIDHDVLVPDHFLWKHVDAHERYPSSIVAGATYGAFLECSLGHFVNRLELDHISLSYPVLSENIELSDPRIRQGCFPDGIDVVDVLRTPAPFHFFWGGNISAYRKDIDECGCFDETYDGWGLEDDDFAQQFRYAGRGMVFSKSAWAFHLPGAPHQLIHIGDWRNNFDTFFRKFSSREIECYSLYGSDLLPLGMRRTEGLLGALKELDVTAMVGRAATRLGSPSGRRLCHLVADSCVAETLELTDALSPFGDPMKLSRCEGRTRWWPLIGLRTPFNGKEIDEVVILVDVLMWLDRYLLTLLLSETVRIAKRIVFCCSTAAVSQARGGPLRTFREILSTFGPTNPSWIET